MTVPTDDEAHDERIIRADETEFESVGDRDHHWYLRPDLVDGTKLQAVIGEFPPGGAHPFHKHPKMEEFLYVLDGSLEQWVEDESYEMDAGDSVHLPAGLVHASYNAGEEPLRILAILSPADTDPPYTVDVSEEEPWCDLR